VGTEDRYDHPVIVIHGEEVTGISYGGEIPAADTVREWGPESVVTPGLVDAYTHLGLKGGADEAHTAVTPELRAADAFQPTPAMRQAVLAAGITTLYLAPGERNLIGGWIAVVKPAPDEEGGWKIVDPRWGIAASLTDGSRIAARAPTSLAGQFSALERLLSEGVLQPRVPLVVRVEEPEEILNASELIRVGAGHVVLAGRPDGYELAAGLPFVILPYAPGDPVQDLLKLLSLAEEELPLAFGSNRAGPHLLRLQAQLAVRMGLKPGRVREALYGGPLMERGALPLPADLVVWSGDPLDGRSRVLATIVGGRILYEAPEKERRGE
jgi:hypothetical protein